MAVGQITSWLTFLSLAHCGRSIYQLIDRRRATLRISFNDARKLLEGAATVVQ